MNRPQLILAPGKEKALLRHHPWIFSGAVRRKVGNPVDGDLVDVLGPDGTWLASGHYQDDSIICKILSFETLDIDLSFFKQRFMSAIGYRRQLGFFDNADTNVFRLVYGEGDNMPGLVCDWYNGILVFQAHSVGIYSLFPQFAEVLHQLLGDSLYAVFDKSSTTLPGGCDDGPVAVYKPGFDIQSFTDWEVQENGIRMVINFYEGQKTGFFIDQRDNRHLVSQLARGRRVLNCFGYTGGFSLAALKGGAEYVLSLIHI